MCNIDADLPMMLHSMMIIGLKRFSTQSLEIHPRLGKSLMCKSLTCRTYCICQQFIRQTFLFTDSRVVSILSQWFPCVSFIWIGVEGENGVLWDACFDHLPCSHKVETTGMLSSKLNLSETVLVKVCLIWLFFTQEAYSTPILPLRILSESAAENKFQIVMKLYFSIHFRWWFPMILTWFLSSYVSSSFWDVLMLSGKGNNFLSSY